MPGKTGRSLDRAVETGRSGVRTGLVRTGVRPSLVGWKLGGDQAARDQDVRCIHLHCTESQGRSTAELL